MYVAGCSSSRTKMKSLSSAGDANPATAMRLRLENERLQGEVAELRKLVTPPTTTGNADGNGSLAQADLDDEASCSTSVPADNVDPAVRVLQLEEELAHAKEALAG